MDASTRLGVLLVATALVVAGVPSVALALAGDEAGPAQIGPDDGPTDPPGPRRGDDGTATSDGETTEPAATNRSTTTDTANGAESDSRSAREASITFRNHSSGGESVLVDSVTLPEGGFVTIYDTRGERTQIVGVTPYLDAGTHSGTVRLGRVRGTAQNLTRLGTNATLVARLHRDTDGDKRFDNRTARGTDGAYLANGTPIEGRARVTVPSDRRPTAPAVTIENQTTDGTNVEVASATLPDGGFVALYHANGSRGSRGAVSGADEGFLAIADAADELANRSPLATTRVLAPGAYADLGLTIGANATDGDLDGLTRNTTVLAVVYNDTNGDGRFDVGSGGDRPERTDGNLVADTARLTIERADANETTTIEPNDTTTAAVDTTTTTGRDATTTGETATRTTIESPSRTDRRTGTGTTTTTTPIPTTTDETTERSTSSTSGMETETTATTSVTEQSVGPGVIAGSGTDTGNRNGPPGEGVTPYGGTDRGERDREAIVRNPLLSVFGIVVVVFVALVAIDWRRDEE